MRSLSRLVLVAVLALGWSALASAANLEDNQSIDPTAFAAITDLQLDAAFEVAMSESSSALFGLSGPTTMECKGAAGSSFETCVVRADGMPSSLTPSALARH
ncbi:MAG: hypothetical protein CL908_09895 [Deltaproteobacteria bacterium]|nr:hypothetical protein [Deltaproteobacteria bacterium]